MFAVAAAGAVSGWSCPALAAAALASALAVWLRVWACSAGHGFVNLDPANPDPSALLAALRLAAARVGETQRPFSLRISSPTREGRPAVRLDLDARGDLVVRGLGKPLALGHPGLWLPDHPLPFGLPSRRCTTLRFSPCGGGRVRVACGLARAWGVAVWVALALLATVACVLDSASGLASVLGFGVTAYLLERQEERAHEDAPVRPH